MDTQAHHDEWENRWQAGQTGWDRGQTSPALQYWLDSGEIQPCRILVPGCGNGYEVLSLADGGYEAVGVDVASTPVANLQTLLADNKLQADVVQANVLEWQPGKPFDAIYEQTCLCALNPKFWEQYEQKLYGWLVDGGKLLAQFMQTGREGGPPFHCAMPDMRELFDAGRWEWRELGHEIPHNNGIFEIQHLLIKR